MIIDIHGHLLPKTYVQALSNRDKIPRVESTGSDKFNIVYGEGYQYTVDQRMSSLEKKLEDMKKACIDSQILGIIMPGVDTLESKKAYEIAKKVNDEYAEVQEKSQGSFYMVGTVPLQDPELAVEELRRMKRDLGMVGVEIFSNVAGKPLDSDQFLPFFAEAESLQTPIMIHPTLPLVAEATSSYGLTGVVGYLFDTTIAVLRIIFSGMLETHPRLKLILPHLGSTIPYLIGRIDHQFAINPECRAKISKRPSEYFKSIYVDTAQALYRPAMECGYQLIGSKRILFGTDYPFADLSKSVQSIKDLDITEEEKRDIFEKNAVELFGI